MNYLIYTEVSLRPDDVDQHLGIVDKTASVRVMVPVRSLTSDEEQFVNVEFPEQEGANRESDHANWRLQHATDTLQAAGFTNVDGETCAASPVDAIETAVEANAIDVVVAITAPTGVAGWVHLDLAHRLERHLDGPVIHVELEPAG